MNRQIIKTVLNSRGIDVKFKFSTAGIVAGVHTGNNQYLCSLIPIDDDSDIRFCDFLEAEVKKIKGSVK